MADKRRLIEQVLWSDDDYLHLGGYEPDAGESDPNWLLRRLSRQCMWLSIIGCVASDWGRFRAAPKRVAGLLMPNVQSDWYESEVVKALDEFEALHWIGRYTYPHRDREIEYGVIWAWHKSHFFKWSKASRIPAPPQELIRTEAERRKLLSHDEAHGRGEMSLELFIATHGWMGTRQALNELHSELVYKQPRAMKRSSR